MKKEKEYFKDLCLKPVLISNIQTHGLFYFSNKLKKQLISVDWENRIKLKRNHWKTIADCFAFKEMPLNQAFNYELWNYFRRFTSSFFLFENKFDMYLIIRATKERNKELKLKATKLYSLVILFEAKPPLIPKRFCFILSPLVSEEVEEARKKVVVKQ